MITYIGSVLVVAYLIAATNGSTGRTLQPGIPDFVARSISSDPADSTDQIARTVAAQESMSAFAFWMLVVSTFTMAVTASGTYAIFRQIRFGQKALEQAKEANRQGLENSQRQLRAYLSISYDPNFGKYSSFHFIVHNSGQTPAKNVFYHVQILYISKHDSVVEIVETDDFDWTNIASGHSHEIPISLPRPKLLPDGSRAPEHDFIQIVIDLQYKTIFDDDADSCIAVNRRGWSDFWMEEDYTVMS